MRQRDIILAGKKVALAEMTLADQPFFQQWLSTNEELRQLIDDERVPTMEDQLKWFERVQKPDRRMFSIVTAPDGVLIGNGGFVDIDLPTGTATLRITIGNSEYLGKGLGSEATLLFMRYAFEHMKLSTLILKVLSSNVRAIRTYAKSGFQYLSEELQGAKIIHTMILKASDFPLPS